MIERRERQEERLRASVCRDPQRAHLKRRAHAALASSFRDFAPSLDKNVAGYLSLGFILGGFDDTISDFARRCCARPAPLSVVIRSGCI